MKVLRINSKDTLPIRQEMLRKGLPESSCVFQNDDNEQTFHLGAFVDNDLVSVASFYFENHPEFSDEFQYRLRGMATLNEYQRKGLSGELLQMAFPVIKQNMASRLWCNARVSAEGFYLRNGFVTHGDVFDIKGVGPHKIMSKIIKV